MFSGIKARHFYNNVAKLNQTKTFFNEVKKKSFCMLKVRSSLFILTR